MRNSLPREFLSGSDGIKIKTSLKILKREKSVNGSEDAEAAEKQPKIPSSTRATGRN